MTDDMRKLLGGYASGTLTEAERKALFEASLEDQQLFEALADEEALKELLADASARATLLQAAETPRFSMTGALREWFERPKAKVLVAAGCVLLAAIGYRSITERSQFSREAVEVARVTVPQDATPVPSAAPIRPAEPQNKAVTAVRRKPGSPQLLPTVPQEPAPPAPAAAAPADGAVPVQAKRSSPVHYAVLRRTSGGEYAAVPEDFLFAPDDRIRLQIEVNEPGMIVVTNEARDVLYRGIVRPGSPLTMPQELSVGDRDRRVLDVRFAPASLLPEQEVRTLRSEFRAESDGGAPRAGARLTSSAAELPMQGALSLQVILRRKP